MNPQCLRVVIDFSSLLEPSNIFRSDSDWYFRCMMDDMVTDVGWRVSQREVIFAWLSEQCPRSSLRVWCDISLFVFGLVVLDIYV